MSSSISRAFFISTAGVLFGAFAAKAQTLTPLNPSPRPIQTLSGSTDPAAQPATATGQPTAQPTAVAGLFGLFVGVGPTYSSP